MIKNIFKDKKAAIFDLDGTLVNSGFVWHKVDVDFFNKRGMDLPKDYIEKIASMSFKEMARFTKEEYNLEESIEDIITQWNELAKYEYINHVKLKEGAREILERLKTADFKIGLATATSDKLFVPCLENNGIYEYFDTYACGSEVKRSKEYPDIFLLCAERLGVNPQDCIVFEDVTKAVMGAKKAGMKTCGVYDNHTSHEWESIQKAADICVRSLAELL